MLQNLGYAYYPTNNVQTITDAVNSGNSQSFSYDNLQRLSSAAGGYGSFAYTYDKDGNLVVDGNGIHVGGSGDSFSNSDSADEPEGEPMRYPIAIADVTTGFNATVGILAALLARERTGKGQFLEVSLFDSQMGWLANVGSGYLNTGRQPRRWGNAHPNIVPYQVFRASDGRHFVVTVGTEALWERFCRVLGIEDTLARDPRFATNADRVAHRDELIPQLEKIFLAHPASHWLEHRRAADVPAGLVQTVEDAFADPQTEARRLVVDLEHSRIGRARSIANPARLSATPPTYRLAPPVLGEHTRPVLAEIGLSSEEIEAAIASGAVAVP